MHIEQHVDIAASPQRVWAVISDVRRWPEWTPTVETLEVLDAPEAGPPDAPHALHVGLRARLKQPGYPPAVWIVRSVDEGRAFTWDSRSLGMRTLASHLLEATASGTHVTLAIDVDGPTAWALRWLVARASRRFLPQEAAALQREAERA